VATQIIPGQRSWSLQRDSCGNRTYRIKHRIKADVTDGPANVIQTPGLPVPGSLWLIDADSDIYAWCRYDAVVTPVVENEPNEYWDVEQTFSTEPLDYRTCACKTSDFQDPLLEPPKVSGTYSRYTVEASKDRFNSAIVTSSHEQIRGPQVEFDEARPTIKIEQNLPTLFLAGTLPNLMINTVNDRPIWGYARRMAKLAGVAWTRAFYQNCLCYFQRTLEFEINVDTWDRKILDEGQKVLSGEWNLSTGNWRLKDLAPGVHPNPSNPAHFVGFSDRFGRPIRAVLDGNGLPAGVTVEATAAQAQAIGDVVTGTGTVTEETGIGTVLVEKYPESNFLLLQVPLTFDC
jgi:hypothetical protein